MQNASNAQNICSPTASSPTVSVIVPIYNIETYLEQALKSICEQTYPHLDIICINDGSTDNSLAIMQSFAKNDSRIRIVDKENGGYGAACNRGIQEAVGEYISIIEPDDWIEPTMYEDLITFIYSFDRPIDIAKSAYWRIVNPDTPQQQKLNCTYRHRIKPAAQPFQIEKAAYHLLSHHPSIWSALYRKGFLETQGIRFREYPGAGWADNPFLIETLCQAETIVFLDKAYYCYREDTLEKMESFAKNNPVMPFDRWHEMMDALDQLGINDEAILEAHYSRGFSYLKTTVCYVPLESNQTLHKAVASMFQRMKKPLVLKSSHISPGAKKLYLETLGLPKESIKTLPYLGSLAGEFFSAIRNNGVGYAFRQTFTFLT